MCFAAVSKRTKFTSLVVRALFQTISMFFASNIFLPVLPTERHKEVLLVAEAPGPRVLSAEEQRRLAEQEDNTLRELRLFLRDVTKRLATDKRFNIFSKPVDIEEVWRNVVAPSGLTLSFGALGLC